MALHVNGFPWWGNTSIANVTASPTGNSATGSAGGVTTIVGKTPTGVAGTGSAGTVTTSAGASKTPTGVAGTGAPGSPTPVVDKTLTGVAGTASPGIVTTGVDATTSPSGNAATASPGTPIATGDANTSPTGVQGDAATNVVLPTVTALPTGNEAIGQVGNATTTNDYGVTPTGVVGTGAAGTPSALGEINALDPADYLSDIMVWTDVKDAATITKNGSNRVSQQTDKSGTGPFTQATGGNQPLYVANAINNQPAIQYKDGATATWLAKADESSLDFTSLHAICVFQPVTDDGNLQTLFGKYTTTGNQREFRMLANMTADQLSIISSATGSSTVIETVDTTPTLAAGTPYIADIYFDVALGQQGSSLMNSAYSTAAQTGIFNGTAEFTMGAINSGATQPYLGYIGEVIVFRRRLSPAEVAGFYKYLRAKWLFDAGIPAVAASGQVGAIIPTVDKAITGNGATGQVGTPTTLVAAQPTGNQGTGNANDVQATSSSNTTPTGVEALGHAGLLSFDGLSQAQPAGVESTGSANDVLTVLQTPLVGQQATASPGNVTTSLGVDPTVTGVQGTALTNDVLADASNANTLDGVEATGHAGSPSANAATSPAPTGVSSSAAVGSVSNTTTHTLTGNQGQASTNDVLTTITTFLTGLVATSGLGTILTALQIFLTGNQATASTNDVQANAATSPIPSGVQGSGSVGEPQTAVSTLLSSNSAASQPGPVQALGISNATVEGPEATGVIGSLTAFASATVALVGVAAQALIGTVTFLVLVALRKYRVRIYRPRFFTVPKTQNRYHIVRIDMPRYTTVPKDTPYP